MPLTLVLFVVCAVPLLCGIYSLARGKRLLGVALLVFALIPIGLIALVAAMMTGTVNSVWPPATQPLSELYKTLVPAQVRIVHYKSEVIGMDPSFWWECSPIEDTYLQAVVKNAALKRSTPEQPGPSFSPQWPVWWKAAQPAPETLPEFYYNDTGDGGLRGIWVDRANNRLFIVFMGT